MNSMILTTYFHDIYQYGKAKFKLIPILHFGIMHDLICVSHGAS